QTQAERQKIVAEFQQLRQFLEQQERLLLAQLQKLEGEIVKIQTDTVTKLSEQISRLSEQIRELEGKCQKPASEFLQDVLVSHLKCEEGQAQQPEEMAPQLEEQVRGFSQKVIALSETLREFKVQLIPLHHLQDCDSDNVTLDEDTAHVLLKLSEDGKCLQWGYDVQSRPDIPERFDVDPCVLGNERFTSGRHSWEVDVGNGHNWAVGVAKESVSRKGGISMTPEGGIWAVQRSGSNCWALTDYVTPLLLSQIPRRVRVCLDCDRGQVVFTNADTENLIYVFPPGSLPQERIQPWLGVW
uniref:B30.2/SPRY domain-containing protein n=1 Tax=Pelodiscus sinensis TaxID=13735 RepID=K7GBG7_PELSI